MRTSRGIALSNGWTIHRWESDCPRPAAPCETRLKAQLEADNGARFQAKSSGNLAMIKGGNWRTTDANRVWRCAVAISNSPNASREFFLQSVLFVAFP